MERMKSKPSERKQILIIDDNKQIHEDFRKVLLVGGKDDNTLDRLEETLLGTSGEKSIEDYSINSAFQGEDGLQEVKKSIKAGNPYSMAFIDVRMPPGSDGVETIRRIWEVQPDLNIVLCTAYSDYSWKDLVEKLGHSDKLVILKKPFDNSEVRQLAYVLTEKSYLNRLVEVKIDELTKANKYLEEEITRREKAEEISAKNEKKFRSIIEHSTNLFYSHTPEHVLTYISPQVKEFFGYTQEEALIKWTDLVSDNPVNKRALEATEAAIETGMAQPPYELEIVHKSGKKSWVEVHEAPVVENGKTVSIVGALTDITDRKNIEAEQKARMNQLEMFNKHAVDRELKMVELKKEVDDLLEKAGMGRKYSTDNKKDF